MGFDFDTLLTQLQPQSNKKDPRQLLKILLIIFGIALIILYVLPDTLALLFTTALGNAILLLGAIYLFFYKDYRLTLLYLLCWVIIARFIERATHEGFATTTTTTAQLPPTTDQQWTSEQIRAFTALQNLINPNINFATEQIQKLATPQELEYFMEHMTWPWSAETEEQYITACAQNPYISDAPDNSLRHAKRIYSQGQIKQILFMQSNQGRALIDGAQLHPIASDAYTRAGIITANTDTGPTIICNSNTGKPLRIEPHGAPINTNGSIGVLERAEAIYPRIQTVPTDNDLTLVGGDTYTTQCSSLF